MSEIVNELAPTEKAVIDAKQRIYEAANAEDPTAVIAHARGLRSALWRRDREQQMAEAQRKRESRQATNRAEYR